MSWQKFIQYLKDTRSFTPNFNQQRNTDTEDRTVEMGNLQLSQDSCQTENELVDKIEGLKISA